MVLPRDRLSRHLMQGAKRQPSLSSRCSLYTSRTSPSRAPARPQSLQGPGQNPQLRVSVNVNAGPRGEDTYEVALQLEVHASSDHGVIYNVELLYGGLFRLRGVPENMLQPVLFVDCPTILFPFVRRVLADVIRDGGFPPLLLDPIDFARLYARNLAQAQGDPQNRRQELTSLVAQPERLGAERRHESAVRLDLRRGQSRSKRPWPRRDALGRSRRAWPIVRH